MTNRKDLDRYKHELGYLIVEVGVKNIRQLFNERDPAPFRERDLDPQFVIYLVSAVEEFSLATKIKIRIIAFEAGDIEPEESLLIREAISSYFAYESRLAKALLRKRHRTARYFSLIGFVTLVVCLSLAQLVDSFSLTPSISNIASVSFVIIGWVAMWHPLETLLYDWWPIREQRKYFEKIALLPVEVVGGLAVSTDGHRS